MGLWRARYAGAGVGTLQSFHRPALVSLYDTRMGLSGIAHRAGRDRPPTQPPFPDPVPSPKVSIETLQHRQGLQAAGRPGVTTA